MQPNLIKQVGYDKVPHETRRITLMRGGLKAIAVGALATVFTVANDVRAFAQAGPNPGDNPKSGTKTEYVVNGKEYPDAGVAGLANSEGGNSMSVVVFRGKQDFDRSEEQLKALYEKYMSKQGVNGKCFVETFEKNAYTMYMLYVNGNSATPNAMSGDQFIELFPKMIAKQKETSSKVAAVDGLSYAK
ncbi:MAG: hypothetical protein JNK00_00240 [Flavipsychrobacter sp.]|nr:hypothetical protein [Flavipsychrobacter sp.]